MSSLGTTIVALAALLTGLWLLSLRLKDSSIVDIFWGLGFVFISWMLNSFTSRGVLVATLVSLWGIRLSAWLARRNIGHGEDSRYQAMRQKWGPRWPLASLLVVFYFQGFLMFVVSWPVQFVVAAPASPLMVIDAMATSIVLLGLGIESVADWQLRQFKLNDLNRGKLIESGLWKYSRHPNYFGDCMVWWGFFLFALGQNAYFTVVGPLMMTVLLRRVSGVTLLESQMSRRPGFEEYARKTNAFVPWFPKK
jgi:steroid 5-alpha reductase family enzyme